MLSPALRTPETSVVLILDYQQHVIEGIESVVAAHDPDEGELDRGGMTAMTARRRVLTRLLQEEIMALPEGSYTQTAFVVRDVEASALRWTALTGAGPWFVLEPQTKNTVYRGRPSNERYRLGMAFAGAALIELIQPMDDEPSILNEVLTERGEGFHHVAPRLTGLSGVTFDERCRDLEAQGLTVALTNEVVGLGRTAFYDAKDTIGGFIEVFELGQVYGMVPLMADLHTTWDGSNPVRPLQTLFGQF